jgi:hypothetical protein
MTIMSGASVMLCRTLQHNRASDWRIRFPPSQLGFLTSPLRQGKFSGLERRWCGMALRGWHRGAHRTCDRAVSAVGCNGARAGVEVGWVLCW